ncbi:MAG TPA: phytanoyl-CoA dioxygenase family protein, partial [Gammaproteobacteria bacterium]|nr:phytanoyl-CoA dioxygenase family protein [Gammaproteobacteria bacterium]
MLSEAQIVFFESEGYLLVGGAIGGGQLRTLRRQFADWVEQSRQHRQAYGRTLDGRARFDLEPRHSTQRPALRRVNAPTDISEDYYRAMRDSDIADYV